MNLQQMKTIALLKKQEKMLIDQIRSFEKQPTRQLEYAFREFKQQLVEVQNQLSSLRI